MKLFAKIVYDFSQKQFILDIWEGSEYGSAACKFLYSVKIRK